MNYRHSYLVEILNMGAFLRVPTSSVADCNDRTSKLACRGLLLQDDIVRQHDMSKMRSICEWHCSLHFVHHMHTQKGAKHAQIKGSTGLGQVLGGEKAKVHDLSVSRQVLRITLLGIRESGKGSQSYLEAEKDSNRRYCRI